MTRQSAADVEMLHQLSGANIIYTNARPIIRYECRRIVRPCPYVGCKYNLFLDVTGDGFSIKLNHPDLEPGDIAPDQSCALDVAKRGGATLEEVGEMMNLTRERIRQIEEMAIRKIRDSEIGELLLQFEI